MDKLNDFNLDINKILQEEQETEEYMKGIYYYEDALKNLNNKISEEEEYIKALEKNINEKGEQITELKIEINRIDMKLDTAKKVLKEKQQIYEQKLEKLIDTYKEMGTVSDVFCDKVKKITDSYGVVAMNEKLFDFRIRNQILEAWRDTNNIDKDSEMSKKLIQLNEELFKVREYNEELELKLKAKLKEIEILENFEHEHEYERLKDEIKILETDIKFLRNKSKIKNKTPTYKGSTIQAKKSPIFQFPKRSQTSITDYIHVTKSPKEYNSYSVKEVLSPDDTGVFEMRNDCEDKKGVRDVYKEIIKEREVYCVNKRKRWVAFNNK